MRAVVQRVKSSSVKIVENNEYKTMGEIKSGFLVLLGIKNDDTSKDLEYIVDKISGLRIFEDKEGKMNLSLLDIKGEMLLVSQFTLYGDCRKGKRPSFTEAARPEKAIPLYEECISKFKEKGINVETGVFGAEMMVSIENDGPVTILIDSEKNF